MTYYYLIFKYRLGEFYITSIDRFKDRKLDCKLYFQSHFNYIFTH